MSLIDDLRTAAGSRLQITQTVTSKIGPKINVGEKFTARFTVRNIDSGLSFKNVKLNVSQTGFATPVSGPTVSFDLAAELPPGSAASVSVQFTATDTADIFIPADESPTGKPIIQIVNEPFANLEVRADGDITSVLSNLSKTTAATVDIRAAEQGASVSA